MDRSDIFIRDDLATAHTAALADIKVLVQALEEIREIYAGMDGFKPETAPEAYQERIIKQMYDAAVSPLSTIKTKYKLEV